MHYIPNRAITKWTWLILEVIAAIWNFSKSTDLTKMRLPAHNLIINFNFNCSNWTERLFIVTMAFAYAKQVIIVQ